jgi:hypothetical protein
MKGKVNNLYTIAQKTGNLIYQTGNSGDKSEKAGDKKM